MVGNQEVCDSNITFIYLHTLTDLFTAIFKIDNMQQIHKEKPPEKALKMDKFIKFFKKLD